MCKPEAAPSPTITWTKNNINLTPDGNRIKMMPNGNLQIRDLTYGDAGFYTCVADNGIQPSARSTGQLVIQGRFLVNTEQRHRKTEHPIQNSIIFQIGYFMFSLLATKSSTFSSYFFTQSNVRYGDVNHLYLVWIPKSNSSSQRRKNTI